MGLFVLPGVLCLSKYVCNLIKTVFKVGNVHERSTPRVHVSRYANLHSTFYARALMAQNAQSLRGITNDFKAGREDCYELGLLSPLLTDWSMGLTILINNYFLGGKCGYCTTTQGNQHQSC